MFRNIIVGLLLLVSPSAFADVDIGVDGVFILSQDLGYNRTGFGIQLDADGRHGDWGWDFQGTALRHSKWLAEGERYHVIGMARRHFNNVFLEVGGEWGGYQSRFPDDVIWEKYGYSAGFGIGYKERDTEFVARYFLPDTTPNNTSIFMLGVDTPFFGSESYVIGLAFELWSFDIGDERLKGHQLGIEFGYRF